jgi:hypothetical protein
MKAGFVPAVALVAATVAAALHLQPHTAAPEAGELARLTIQNELLQRQLDLAKGKDFYLLLDLQSKDLSLMYKAALLQRYQVEGLEVGSRG